MKSIWQYVVLLLIPSTIAFGQEYQPIHTHRTAYFADQYNNVKCIRIDSTEYQTDSVYYPFSQIREIEGMCMTPYGASWVGRKVIIKENGSNIFFNKHSDSIQIQTKASLNDSWTVLNLPDSLTIIATVIDHDTLSFLGLKDSVKTVAFQVYDKNMNPLEAALNQMHLQISKHYGFVKALNFYLFPSFEESFPFERFEAYDLIGLSNPAIGFQNLTWFDVHDFQVGDELHILDESSDWGVVYNYTITNKAIYRYLERRDFPDSIVYTYSRKQSIHTRWADSSSFKFYNDTLKSTIKPDLQFDSKLPEEPVISNYEAYAYSMACDATISKTEPSLYLHIWPNYDSCWGNCCVDGCFPSYTYIKGLGGPYYWCDNAFSLGGSERKLVYFKKGGITSGTPLLVTKMNEYTKENTIKVYPNPAHDFINIEIGELNSRVIFELIDMNGRMILSKTIDSNEMKIKTGELKPGMYFCRLRTDNQILKTDKLTIE